MLANRSVLAAFAVTGFMFAPVPVHAQQSPEEAKANLAIWGNAIGTAFAPGFWEIETREIDESGKEPKVSRESDCINKYEGFKFGNSISEMASRLIDVADCTTYSEGRGSLNLKVACDGIGNRNRRSVVVSSGNYTNDEVNWTIEVRLEGSGKPKTKIIQIVARRIKATCP